MKEIILDIEVRAKRLSIPVYKLCQDAGVNVNIVSKWKKRGNAQVGTIKRLTDKLDEMENG